MEDAKLSYARIVIMKNNEQRILEALQVLGTATATDIHKYLKNKVARQNQENVKELKKGYERGDYNLSVMKQKIRNSGQTAISKRTIERHLIKLQRILRVRKNGWKYMLNVEGLADEKLGDPKTYGMQLTHELMGGVYERIYEKHSELPDFPKNLEKLKMDEMIISLGTLMVFFFLEAGLPIHDNSITKKERYSLVYYWIEDVLPIRYIYEMFCSIFDPVTDDDKGTFAGPNKIYKKIVSNEINENKVKELDQLLQGCVPKTYQALIRGKQRGTYHKIEKDGKLVTISGKSWTYRK